jgi:3,4-dihydroxy-2-butanone 4-phosphate synthase
MQIRKIIEHKYSYSHKKSTTIIRKEKREFFVSILVKSREKHKNFKNPSKIKGL